MVRQSLVSLLQDWIKVKDRELKAAQKERNKVDINISTKQNQVRSYGEEKKRKEEEVQSKTERIRDKCGDQKLADKAFEVSIKIDKGNPIRPVVSNLKLPRRAL